MLKDKMEIFEEAQIFAAGAYGISKVETSLKGISKYDFFKAVFIAIDKMEVNTNYDYYFSKLNINKGQTKADLFEGVRSLAEEPTPLCIRQVDAGLRCISSVLNSGVKDEKKKIILFEEIWNLIGVFLTFNLFAVSRSLIA